MKNRWNFTKAFGWVEATQGQPLEGDVHKMSLRHSGSWKINKKS
jgi:hypothetical protein